MIYKGNKKNYFVYHFSPFACLLCFFCMLMYEKIFKLNLGIITFAKICMLFIFLISLIVSFDIVSGCKKSKVRNEEIRKKMLKENKEIFFTFTGPIGVIYLTTLGIESYKVKNIFLGILRKFKNKDFYIPYEEIVKIKSFKDIIRVILKDETSIIICFEGNLEAVKKFEEIFMTKIKK